MGLALTAVRRERNNRNNRNSRSHFGILCS
jgi:hypothetical protein